MSLSGRETIGKEFRFDSLPMSFDCIRFLCNRVHTFYTIGLM